MKDKEVDIHNPSGHMNNTLSSRGDPQTLYNHLIDTIKDVIMTMDLDGNITCISPYIEKLTGYTPDEVISSGPKLIISPEDIERAVEILYERLSMQNSSQYENIRNQNIEIELKKKDGGMVPVDIRTSFLRNDDHIPVGVIGVVRDITERKEMLKALEKANLELEKRVDERTQELKNSERLYRLLAENTKDVICTINLDMKFSYISPSCERLLGYTPEEIRGVSMTDILPPASIKAALEDLDEAVKAEHTPMKDELRGGLIELEALHRDGHHVWIEVKRSFLRDKEGNPEFGLCTIRDITQRKKAQDEKEDLYRQLIESQKMETMGRMAGGIAHDFNNIITALMGQSDLLLARSGSDPRMAGGLEKISLVLKKASALTKQILTFSRGQMIHAVPLNLDPVIKETIEIIKGGINKDIAIEIRRSTPGRLWNIKADRTNMEQIIMNLVINASDAMQEGGRLLIETRNKVVSGKEVSNMPGSRTGEYVQLRVSDTGRGIDQEILPKIFEPFFTTKSMSGGTGLGLSVVYGIVCQHKGWIDVKSSPDKGTAFEIYLPRVDLDEPAQAKTSHDLHEIRGKGEGILLIEDQEDVRDLASAALRQNGYIVFEAANATEGIRIFREEKDLINMLFSCVYLKDKSGIDLAKTITRIRPDIALVFTDGDREAKTKAEQEYSPINNSDIAFLEKPYSVFELLNTIKNTLRNNCA
ncbi:MAG: PAS domain S-box protein [Thermodesulfobacteriota bacterium]|nr:PAS domain S-box protein [Thermodesulfobacteriota bacterium]